VVKVFILRKAAASKQGVQKHCLRLQYIMSAQLWMKAIAVSGKTAGCRGPG
jgi:hypothetical protein